MSITSNKRNTAAPSLGMLATIGDEFTWAGGNGLTQTKGSEGFILHGKGRYVRPREIKGFSRTPGSWYRTSCICTLE